MMTQGSSKHKKNLKVKLCMKIASNNEELYKNERQYLGWNSHSKYFQIF